MEARPAALTIEMAGCVSNLLGFLPYIAVAIALIGVALRESRNRSNQEDIARRGVEVEAEILGHFEAGTPLGQPLPPTIASWDPLELELRYVFEGREIVSRGRVSVKNFFHTRGMKTLTIKVSPEQPEQWTALD